MPRQSDLRFIFAPLKDDPFEVVSFTLEEGLSLIDILIEIWTSLSSLFAPINHPSWQRIVSDLTAGAHR
ncbi:MAG: hypothetical protein ACRESJ_14450 [Pseudomonas sp.]|uniref:hypothetical protein n=1 Tax=Pseudomonas sp. TaxID=306 RepID=UPI003D6FF666